MSAIANFVRRECGQELVEMALVLPIFFLLTLGVLDLGRAVMASHNVAEAERAGARYGVTAPLDCAGIKNSAVSGASAIALATSNIAVSEPSGAAFGAPVSVVATTTFTPVTPMIGAFLPGGQLTLRGAATMTIEYVGSGPGC